MDTDRDTDNAYFAALDDAINGGDQQTRDHGAEIVVLLDGKDLGADVDFSTDADAKADAAWLEWQADLAADRQAAGLPDPRQATREELAVSDSDYLRDQLAFGGSRADREVE